MLRTLASASLSMLLASWAMAQDNDPPPDILEVEYFFCQIPDKAEALVAVYPKENTEGSDSEFIGITSGGLTFNAKRSSDGFYVDTDAAPNNLLKFNEDRIISVFGDSVSTGTCHDVTEGVQSVTNLILEAQTGDNVEELKSQVEELRATRLRLENQLSSINGKHVARLDDIKVDYEEKIGELKADLEHFRKQNRSARITIRNNYILLGEKHLAELNEQIKPCWKPSGTAILQTVAISARVLSNGQLSGLGSHVEFIPSRDAYHTAAANQVIDALTECTVRFSYFHLPADANIMLYFHGSEGVVSSFPDLSME